MAGGKMLIWDMLRPFIKGGGFFASQSVELAYRSWGDLRLFFLFCFSKNLARLLLTPTPLSQVLLLEPFHTVLPRHQQ